MEAHVAGSTTTIQVPDPFAERFPSHAAEQHGETARRWRQGLGSWTVLDDADGVSNAAWEDVPVAAELAAWLLPQRPGGIYFDEVRYGACSFLGWWTLVDISPYGRLWRALWLYGLLSALWLLTGQRKKSPPRSDP